MDMFRKKSLEDIETLVSSSQLSKTLKAKDIACMGMGAVIGTGIFVVTGLGAHLAGPAIIISFILTAIVSSLCALAYSELATMFPVSGGTYSYTFIAFGEIVAWMTGWILILAYLVNCSAVACGWSAAVVGLLKGFGIEIPKFLAVSCFVDPEGGINLLALLMALGISYILYLGVSQSAKVNNIIIVIKVSIILLFIALGIGHVNFNNFEPFAPFGWNGILAGAAVVFFAYTGFDAVSTAAEETVNPGRNIPLGLGICMTVVIILYVAVSFVLTGMVPFDTIDITNPLPAALMSIGVQWGSALVAVGAIIGMLSSFMVTLYGQIRVFMTMSRDGLLPGLFSKVHPVHVSSVYLLWSRRRRPYPHYHGVSYGSGGRNGGLPECPR